MKEEEFTKPIKAEKLDSEAAMNKCYSKPQILLAGLRRASKPSRDTTTHTSKIDQ